MSFLKNQHKVESFAKTDDQLYTEIFSHLIADFYFGKEKEKEKNSISMKFLMRSYDHNFLLYKFFLNISFLALLIFIIAQFFQCVGLFPSKAVASPLPPSNTAVTLKNPSIKSRNEGYTLSGKDTSPKKFKSVIISGMQPRRSAVNRASSRRCYTSRSKSGSSSHSLHTSTRRGTGLLFGYNFTQIINNNQILHVATMQVARVPIQITKYQLIRNETFSLEENLRVEKFIEGLASQIELDERLDQINKYFNIQGWTVIDEVPTLTFNFDASYGPHHQNKGLSRRVKIILEYYLKQNADFFTEKNQIAIAFRPSESEHPNQKQDLQGAGLNREDAHTYQLERINHKLKTDKVELMLLTTVNDIPESFLYNGEATIKAIQTLWDQGKLTDSVESMDMFNHAIRECMKDDIADYHEMNRPNETLDFSGQLNTSKMGAKQCHDFFELLLNTKTKNLKESSCVEALKAFAEGGVVRGAYVNQGLNTFDKDSRSHEQQLQYAKFFAQRFTAAIEQGIKHFPYLKEDTKFMQDYSNVLLSLNGKGPYQEVIEGPAFAAFKASLNDPKKQTKLVARNLKEYILTNRGAGN